ncbi:hypothetical protein ACLOJK_005389 [Asimina triloba]
MHFLLRRSPASRTFLFNCRSFHSSLSTLLSQPQQQKTPLRIDDLGPLACLLKSRSVIRFQGPDTVKFLQGLLTNDVTRLAEPPREKAAAFPTPNLPLWSTPPIYAALLTPQGRFLYDLFLYRPTRLGEKLDSTGSGPGQEPDGDSLALFADVDANFVDELLDCFKKISGNYLYRLRSKVDIENVSEEFSCWQRFGGKLSVKASSADKEPEADSVGWGGSVDHAGVSSAQGNNHGWQWFIDPRLDCLGFRGIFPSNSIPPLVEFDKDTSEEFYLLSRLEKGVAEGSTEIPKGEAIPLEYNLAGLNAISFDKGCYLGQELVARTHHRGVIRKRLLPLKLVDNNGEELQQKVAPGSEVLDATSHKKVGSVTTTLGCRAMGVLRLKEALTGSNELRIKENEEVKVQVIRPKWWPAEWLLQSEEEHSAVNELNKCSLVGSVNLGVQSTEDRKHVTVYSYGLFHDHESLLLALEFMILALPSVADIRESGCSRWVEYALKGSSSHVTFCHFPQLIYLSCLLFVQVSAITRNSVKAVGLCIRIPGKETIVQKFIYHTVPVGGGGENDAGRNPPPNDYVKRSQTREYIWLLSHIPVKTHNNGLRPQTSMIILAKDPNASNMRTADHEALSVCFGIWTAVDL